MISPTESLEYVTQRLNEIVQPFLNVDPVTGKFLEQVGYPRRHLPNGWPSSEEDGTWIWLLAYEKPPGPRNIEQACFTLAQKRADLYPQPGFYVNLSFVSTELQPSLDEYRTFLERCVAKQTHSRSGARG